MYTYRAERHDVRGMGSCKIRTANARSSITRPSPDLACSGVLGLGEEEKGTCGERQGSTIAPWTECGKQIDIRSRARSIRLREPCRGEEPRATWEPIRRSEAFSSPTLPASAGSTFAM